MTSQFTHLGPYEIRKRIGRGGMGSVFEAVDHQTGQRVAVKALSPQLAQAEGFRERFEAEIRMLKKLRHEGIVRFFGEGEQDGVLFYSMELVDGTSLEDELRAGRRFGWREVTDIAVQLCLALKHAHDHGIFHRDIKPANILIAADDRVKLTDFGIARPFEGTQLTTAGGVLGTADYMSPEQAEGRPVSARCDQYSLGGVMYALLAGRPPFRANNLPEMLQLQRFAEPEPVRRYSDQTPEQLERLIHQLLSKDPADRFPNTMVLARHLQAMAKALSRPTQGDFTLEEHDSPGRLTPGLDDSLALAVTQEDAGNRRPPSADGAADSRIEASPDHDGATLATDEADEDASIDLPPIVGAAPSAAADSPPPPVPPASTTRFTTIEEEQAQQLALHRRPWIVVAAQWAGLAVAAAAVAGLAYYVTRPATADQLYQKIAARAKTADADSIRDVEAHIDEFLARFADDPRTAEVKSYQEALALDRLQKQLQLRSRRDGPIDSSLLPVEMLYVQALRTTERSMPEAARMFQSLVELYGVDAAPGADSPSADQEQRARQQACVQLARRQMASLQQAMAEQSASQLASLRERLATARQLAADQPDASADICRAILELHADDPWAKEIVAEARRQLDELRPRQPQD